jgi:hypothetical protein
MDFGLRCRQNLQYKVGKNSDDTYILVEQQAVPVINLQTLTQPEWTF